MISNETKMKGGSGNQEPFSEADGIRQLEVVLEVMGPEAQARMLTWAADKFLGCALVEKPDPRIEEAKHQINDDVAKIRFDNAIDRKKACEGWEGY